MAHRNRPGQGAFRLTRRAAGLSALSVLLAACGSSLSGRSTPSYRPAPPPPPPAPPEGGLRVGLILPLSGPGGVGATAMAMKNASELAVAELNDPKLQLIVRDDAGSPEGARAAAQAVLSEGADLILGPILAPSVQVVGQVARAAGKPVLAFSTDATVAGPGVYLLSFLPDTEVDRIVDYAGSRGKTSIAAMIPNTGYGNVAMASVQEAAARRGIRVALIERYAPNDRASLDAAARKVAALGDRVDALFLPENGDGAAATAAALAGAGVRLQLLGTSAWDDSRLLALKPFQGGWYAAPDKTGYTAFAAKYRARYGTDPARTASLAYDATFLVEALFARSGPAGLTDAALTNADGVVGTDGLFRLRPDGTNQRGLAVLQVGAGSASAVSPAPRAFAAGT